MRFRPTLLAALTLLVCGAVCAARSQSAGFVGTKGRELVAPDGTTLFLKGINLGNWLVPEGYMFKFDSAASPRQIGEVIAELVGPEEAEAFWKEYRACYISRDDIRLIGRLGFNSVRIPFNFRVLTPEDQPGVWRKEGFALLDSVIAWCREENIGVVLDMHCAPGGQTGDNIDDSWGYAWLFESPAAQQRTADVWKTIAARYARETTVIGYDLMNEPIPHFYDTKRLNPLLEPLYRKIVAAIREVDQQHLVFLGGAQWDTNFDVFGPPFDARAVYTFHRYWSDTTESVIRDFLNFRERYGVPIWMGESGENTDAWIGSFRRLLEKEGIGWCFWPYKKMDARSCPVTFDRPPFWAEIVRFANLPRATFGELRRVRPDIAHVRTALRGFLDNCRTGQCRVNEGYLRALGMKEIPAHVR